MSLTLSKQTRFEDVFPMENGAKIHCKLGKSLVISPLKFVWVFFSLYLTKKGANNLKRHVVAPKFLFKLLLMDKILHH